MENIITISSNLSCERGAGKNIAIELDFGIFQADCLAIGKGEQRPFATDKGREFFERSSTVRSCREYALLVSKICTINSKLGNPNTEVDCLIN